jgi:hypothetical protein
MANKWTTVSVANAPSGFNAGTMLLMTDGSVMIHGDTSQNWVRLTPGNDPDDELDPRVLRLRRTYGRPHVRDRR